MSDVASAHINALGRATEAKESSDNFEIFNIGSGNGYSVLEMVQSFMKVTGKDVPYELVGRRPGDVEAVYADTTKANEVLGWSTIKSLDEMLKSAWDWEQAVARE